MASADSRRDDPQDGLELEMPPSIEPRRELLDVDRAIRGSARGGWGSGAF